MSGAAPRVAFFLDLGEPECRLTLPQVEEICARRGVPLDLIPVSSGDLDRLLGRRPVPVPAAERLGRLADLQRRAARLGLAMSQAEALAADATLAMRACHAAREAGLLDAWCRRLLELRWAEGADISQADVVRAAAQALGLDGGGTLTAAASKGAAWLEQNAASAAARGVFGVPTCAVGDDLFYGECRLPLLEDRLAEITLPEGTAATTSFNRWFGMRCLSRGEGRSEYEFVVTPRVTNRRGVAHGGVTSSLLDTALGAAVVSGIKPEEWCATLELSVQFRRPLRMGRVTARGRMVQRGRHAAFAEGEIQGPDGEILASAHGTWYVWPSRPRD